MKRLKKLDSHMNGQKLPPIGSIMYDVHEHLYYIPNHAGPVKEYVVVAGEVTGFLEGRYSEIRLLGRVVDRVCPWYRKISDIGKTVFYTPYEAAIYAKKLTEKYDKIWSEISNDPPMRRTWEHYITNKE